MSLAVRQIASYQEVRTYWDIDEVYAIQELLDMQDDLQTEQLEAMKRRAT